MDYVALLRFRSSVSSADRDAALGRRAGWQYPAGVRVIAEYWPMTSQVTVVSIFNTDDVAAAMEFQLEWSDVFEIDVSPAVSAQDGLRIGAQAMGRLNRTHQ
jgi:hypothetical protein